MLFVNYCIRIVQKILYISQILNFNEKHSDMPNKQNFRKELNSKIFKKRSYTQTDTTYNFFRAIGLFMSLGVAIFRVTLCDPAQTFVKEATIYKNDLTQFVLVFSTWKEKREKITVLY